MFDTDPDVQSSIAWSSHLDPLFSNNLERDSALSWQYFGSSLGFLRRYPGTQWPQDGSKDARPIHDFRSEDWFIQAASSPKDIVSAAFGFTKFDHIYCTNFGFQMILLDSSGSMSGTSFELAITTIGAILDTLSDDDFVNVVVFSDTTRSAVPCFRDKLVRLYNTERSNCFCIKDFQL